MLPHSSRVPVTHHCLPAAYVELSVHEQAQHEGQYIAQTKAIYQPAHQTAVTIIKYPEI